MPRLMLLVASSLLLAASVLQSGSLRYHAYSFLMRLAHKEGIDSVRPFARVFGRSINDSDAALRVALREMESDRSFDLPWLLMLLKFSGQVSLVDELRRLYGSPQMSSVGRINSAYALALITEDKMWLSEMLEVAKDGDPLDQRLACIRVWALISESDLEDPALSGLIEPNIERDWIDWVTVERVRARLKSVRDQLIHSE